MSNVKVFTSYHAKSKKLAEAGVMYISISKGNARFGLPPAHKLLELAPAGDMLKLPNEEYVPRFNAILAAQNPQEVLGKIKQLAADAGMHSVALCCFEKPTDFCHRFMVSDWLMQGTGENIPEWGLDEAENQRIQEIQAGYFKSPTA